MKTILKDLQYGLRSLLKRPGFFAIAVLTLGLGIGANSAIFSTVNAVLLRPLSFPDSESLVLLEGVHTRQGITQSNMSVPDIVDWQNQNQSFEQIAGFVTGGVLMMSNDETERVLAAGVSGDFFALMRTNAELGRTLQPGDAQKGHDNVAALSYGLWQKRFGGDPAVIGTKVMISGDNTTIVGVMPKGFPRKSEGMERCELEPGSGSDWFQFKNGPFISGRFLNSGLGSNPVATAPGSNSSPDDELKNSLVLCLM